MGQHYKHFDLDDRFELYRLIEAGLAQKEIANLMDRTKSTISREIKRNSLPKGDFKPASADPSLYHVSDVNRCWSVSARLVNMFETA